MNPQRRLIVSVCSLAVAIGTLIGCGSDSPTPPTSTYSISGKVSPASSESVEGVVITIGSRKDTTDASGTWSVAGFEPGGYTITPAKPGNTFTPPARAVTITSADAAAQDFVIAGDVAVPTHPEMVAVPAGTFMMGGTQGEVGGSSLSRPKHQVTITKPMLVAKTETTQEQFASVMGFNPSRDTIINGAVSGFLFLEILEYCNKVSDAEGLQRAYTITGSDFVWDRNANGYRLPTEAEWEYFARAGDTNNTYNGYYDDNNPSAVLEAIAWYRYNTSTPPDFLMQNSKPQKVGLKVPNAWGLYDVLGNHVEVVIDGFARYSSDPQVDPYVPHSPSGVMYRGGSCGSVGSQITLSGRDETPPLTRNARVSGFRIVRNN